MVLLLFPRVSDSVESLAMLCWRNGCWAWVCLINMPLDLSPAMPAIKKETLKTGGWPRVFIRAVQDLPQEPKDKAAVSFSLFCIYPSLSILFETLILEAFPDFLWPMNFCLSLSLSPVPWQWQTSDSKQIQKEYVYLSLPPPSLFFLSPSLFHTLLRGSWWIPNAWVRFIILELSSLIPNWQRRIGEVSSRDSLLSPSQLLLNFQEGPHPNSTPPTLT